MTDHLPVLPDVLELLADDIEDMRVNGYRVGTQLVRRVRAIAAQARKHIAEHDQQSRDALAAARTEVERLTGELAASKRYGEAEYGIETLCRAEWYAAAAERDEARAALARVEAENAALRAEYVCTEPCPRCEGRGHHVMGREGDTWPMGCLWCGGKGTVPLNGAALAAAPSEGVVAGQWIADETEHV